MTLFDSLALTVLAISMVYSIFRGMVREIFSLLAYFGAYLVAVKFQNNFAQTLGGYIPNETASVLISFAMIFFATVVAISLVGKGFQKLVHSTAGLSGVDRILGGVIGIAKAVIILIILMFPLKFFPDLNGKINKDSILAPHLDEVSRVLVQAMHADHMMEKFPDINLDGVKEKFRNLKDMDKIAQDLNSKGKGSRDNSEASQKVIGKPQDNYTKEDQKKLKDLLLSLEKK